MHTPTPPVTPETIVAIATPAGRGGVGVIRLSGPQALKIAEQLSAISLKKLKPRQVLYTRFIDEAKDTLDEGLLLYFQAPHSFTGEDVIEFQCHGSPFVLDSLVALCLRRGARLAQPGEFTQRAFLNDKIDLTQAEAIADLINASSKTAARMAIKSLQGEFSKQINELNEQIIQLRVYVEASLDFADEDIDFIAEGKIAKKIKVLIETLEKLRRQAAQGVLLKEGLSLVIAGAPNAGKSTLINLLAGRDVAIVTEIPGTTRDVMREHIVLDDLPLHLMDTAGLRETEDVVEQEGIKRALSALKKADGILWVRDIQHPSEAYNEHMALIAPYVEAGVPVIEVINKIDLLKQVPQQIDNRPLSKLAAEDEVRGKAARRAGVYTQVHEDSSTDSTKQFASAVEFRKRSNQIYVSAKTGAGLDLLKEKIKALLGYQPSEGLFLARRRHLDALDRSGSFLNKAEEQLNHAAAIELLAEDLRGAHEALSEITGEFTSDDLLGKIFSTFCIGK